MIYIYSGTGASRESITQTTYALKEFTNTISELDEKKLLQGDWVRDAKLFIMPGGADVPYVKKLNGDGNKIIRTFVENGGSYLGLCAGAYYGSDYVEFDKAGPLEVLGKRELAFFPGKAIGPILAKYDYNSKKGARAAKIESKNEPLFVYFSGGSYFENAETFPEVKVLAHYIYEGKRLPAIVKTNPKKGAVVLSGVHFEYSPDLLDPKDPYLKEIIPALEKTDRERRTLIKNILKELNYL